MVGARCKPRFHALAGQLVFLLDGLEPVSLLLGYGHSAVVWWMVSDCEAGLAGMVCFACMAQGAHSSGWRGVGADRGLRGTRLLENPDLWGGMPIN